MKKILFGLLALSSLLLAACDGKEKEGGKDDVTNEVTLTETDNQIVIKQVLTQYGITVTSTYEWNFQNDICTSATLTATYPSASLAQIAYDGIVEDLEKDEQGRNRIADYSVKGKSLIYDMSKLYAGASKDNVLLFATALKESLETTNYQDED
jgi:hypothetical protein